ncbi:hypothetical protein AKJ16_DCAP09911 [Drosera capensis]
MVMNELRFVYAADDDENIMAKVKNTGELERANCEADDIANAAIDSDFTVSDFRKDFSKQCLKLHLFWKVTVVCFLLLREKQFLLRHVLWSAVIVTS